MKEVVIMNFWIVFALYGAIAIPCLVMIIGFWNGWKDAFVRFLVVFVFWFAISGACWFNAENNAKKWNNGFCECGTHWELTGVSKYRSSETKYYTCSNCYAEIEINK